MSKNLAIIVVVILVIGAYFYKKHQDSTTEIQLGNTKIEITKPE